MHITVASVATMLGFVIINLEVVLKGRKIEYDEYFGGDCLLLMNLSCVESMTKSFTIPP